MRDKKNISGFTIIELMIVVIMIGVFAAIAADFVGESKSNDLLTKAADNIQGIAGRGRSQVMQDHRAYVFEYRAVMNRISLFWVNALVDGMCWSSIETHCIERYDNLASAPAYLETDVRVSAIKGYAIDRTSGACQKLQPPVINGALCFSGSGELYYRPADEQSAPCSSADTAVHSDETVWRKVCGSGFHLVLNRFEHNNPVGVERTVVFPPFDMPAVTLPDGGH